MKKKIYSFLFTRIFGWKLVGTLSPDVKKCVFMVLHHTSWYDFFLGLFARGIVGLEMNFVGKKELFAFPLGYYFKSIGGAPLDRSGNKNNVDATVDVFNSREVFRLAIAPEGTRKKVTQLRSGFYYIALKANALIVPVAFDYSKKEIRFGTPFKPTGAYDEDLKQILPFFKGVKGKITENDFDIESFDTNNK